jgi:hypothetical protein
MTIFYDWKILATVDSETGDYLKVTNSHYSIPEITYALKNKNKKALLVADIVNDGKMIEVSGGKLLIQKCTLIKAWDPRKNIPFHSPSNFEVSQDLIDRLALFLRRRLETEFDRSPLPQFEFVDGRAGAGVSK